jgi:ATP-dependent DNA helicase RecQ
MGLDLQKIELALKQVLEHTLGPKAEQRPEQLEVLTKLFIEKINMLLVQPTAWGKSMVYWGAAQALREDGEGITLIVSPLIALMSDQVKQGQAAGLSIYTLNSNNREDWDEIMDLLLLDKVDVLLISPEFLGSAKRFAEIRDYISLVVLDEAHCIADWAEFRVDYLRIAMRLREIPGVRVLAVTATADEYTESRILFQIPGKTEVMRGQANNESVRYVIHRVPPRKVKQWLAEFLKSFKGSILIYSFKRDNVKEIAAFLNTRGLKVLEYHSKVDREDKNLAASKWMDNEIDALICTSSFGMGINKSKVDVVIHIGIQPSVSSYAQQVGRAGRNGEEAIAVLIPLKGEDSKLARDFPEYKLTTGSELEVVYRQLPDVGVLRSFDDIKKDVSCNKNELTKRLKLLASQGAIEQDEDSWYRVHDNWEFDAANQQEMIEHRRYQVEGMLDYSLTDTCLPNFIQPFLADNQERSPCGKCSNCTGEVPDILKFDY